MNIVLISRTASKLEDVAKEISKQTCRRVTMLIFLEEKSPVEIKVVQADFSSKSPELYTTIAEAIKGLDIGVLGMYRLSIRLTHMQLITLVSHMTTPSILISCLRRF